MVPPADYANPSLGMMDDFGINNNGDFSWEMIGLGLEEPLPRQDIIDDMYVTQPGVDLTLAKSF